MSRKKEALSILADNPGISAREFADLFWPESPMHTKHSKCAEGIQVGKAAWLCAGSYMGKLRKKGLVLNSANGGYRLSGAGFDELKK